MNIIPCNDENLNNFFNFLLYEKKYSINTYLSYFRDIEQFGKICYDVSIKEQNISWQQVSKFDIHKYIEQINQSCTKNSLLRKLSSLRTLFNFLVKHHIVEQNIFLDIKGARKDKKILTILTQEQVKTLLDAPLNYHYSFENPTDKAYFTALRDSAILEVIYSAGLRISEVLNMQVTDLKNDHFIVKGKGNKQRICFLGSFAKKALDLYVSYAKDFITDNLFINQQYRTKLTSRSVQRNLKKYLSFAQLDSQITPHILRHSFASHLLENGADLKSVQEMLGHKSLASTQIYIHLNMTNLINIYHKTHPQAINIKDTYS